MAPNLAADGPASTGAAAGTLLRLGDTSQVVLFVALVVVLVGAAALVQDFGGLGHGRDVLTAALRATAQLAAVGLVITAVLGHWASTILFALAMVAVAGATSGGRMRATRRWWALVPVTAGAVPVVAAIVASGVVPTEPVAVVPTAGILVGGAMTATTIAGRTTLDALAERRGEVEAGLSIGLLERDAALLVAGDVVGLAVVPGLDQTRTVGLVTLPGAFVGSLLGGASPLQAAALQLLVLVGLLLVQAIAARVCLELVVTGRLRRGEASRSRRRRS